MSIILKDTVMYATDLHTFNPTDSNTNVCFLYHANIIGTITDCESGLPSSFFYQPCDLAPED